jgi:hypothetical protein
MKPGLLPAKRQRIERMKAAMAQRRGRIAEKRISMMLCFRDLNIGSEARDFAGRYKFQKRLLRLEGGIG